MSAVDRRERPWRETAARGAGALERRERATAAPARSAPRDLSAGARASRAVGRAVLRRGIRTGSLRVLEDGAALRFGSGELQASVEIHSARAWSKLLRGGTRGLADAYELGWWDSPDLVAAIRLAARNVGGLDRVRARIAPALAPARALGGALRPSTRARRRRDIAAHYDLGDELFEVMLDPTLSYSCAVFEREGMTLEQAQVAKLERVCARLDLGPGDHVVEIGTGWGGFALHAARTRGCRVTTTISRRQYEHARARVLEAGLQALVDVRMEDYRDLRGRYDKLVSIEMIEAVGWRHFGAFFAHCSRLLAPHGAMLLQAITIEDRLYEAEKAARSFINTRIFPGGCLPSLGVIERCVARATDMRTAALEDITAHYVPTLRRWRENLLAGASRLERLGYDERFRRLWSLYLAYCEAGFAERRIGDVQLLLVKPAWDGAGASAPPAGPARAAGAAGHKEDASTARMG